MLMFQNIINYADMIFNDNFSLFLTESKVQRLKV